MATPPKFDGIPGEGFLVRTDPPPNLPGDQKAALIRKGNLLFNEGNVELAKRIFLTLRYGDGLIRLGDYYFKKNQPLEAFRMYWIAKEKRKSDALIEKMAHVIQELLKSGGM